MNIPFSPPDISEAEINEVAEALRSGWITTGPRVKSLENRLSEYCHTSKTVCLNSATASEELNFIKSPPIQIISRLRSLIALEYLVDVIML